MAVCHTRSKVAEPVSERSFSQETFSTKKAIRPEIIPKLSRLSKLGGRVVVVVERLI